MNRVQLISALSGMSFLLLLSSSLTLAQQGETEPVSLELIAGEVYQLKGGKGANGGAIIGDNGVLVIDSKMDEISVNQSIEAIKNLTDLPIKYLVNTHSDGDHILGNRYYPESLTFVAHQNCRDDFFKVNFGRPSDWGEEEFYPFTPSLTFIEDLNIWLGRVLIELHYFGVGHTSGDLVVYEPDTKVAFLGDQYFNNRPQLIHSSKNGNSFEYVKTLTKMLESLDAETFLSGHSDPVGREDIEKHILVMVERQEKVKKSIGEDKSLEEVLAEFGEDEARLVTSIYNELTEQPDTSSPDPDPYKTQ